MTARADIVSVSNPPVLGVWKSWEGTDHDLTGRPITPVYAEHKKARFLSWLASGPLATDMDSPPDTKAAANKVTLLGEKSVGTKDPAKRQVHLTATRVTIGNQRGSYAWWVSGENQKARLPRPYVPTTENAATWSDLAKSHSTADPKPFGLDSLLTDASLKNPAAMSPGAKAITIKQGDLLDYSITGSQTLSQEHFHDLTVNSIGLLTNTATGGWRKDLSLVSDGWTGLATSGLPFFRVTPAKDLLFTRPESDPLNARSILYPWSDYRRGATSHIPIYSFPAIGSWANLANYCSLYKEFSATNAGTGITAEAQAARIDGDVYNYIHKARILPVIARVQWIYSHKVTPSGKFPGKSDLNLVVTPVFTLWNPYNTRIASTPNLEFILYGSLPPLITYKIGGAALTDPKPVTLQTDEIAGDTTANGRGLTKKTTYKLSSVGTFAPGETRVYSPIDATNALVAGYTPGMGVSYPVETGGSTTPAYATSSKISTSVSFDSEFKDNGAIGVGLYLDMRSPQGNGAGVPVGNVLAYRMSYEKTAARLFYLLFQPGLSLPRRWNRRRRRLLFYPSPSAPAWRATPTFLPRASCSPVRS